ncbi:CTP-dependent riboflavin kinase [Candidatus Micrarchaeota archaeon]|nr:CTP-dependent riboflavin kinase [Candidatus Micrarchaeota archaeon]
MDEMLLVLLRRRAHKFPVKITTSSLGAEAGMSQQNASRKLTMLARDGFIERGTEGIRLTKKAYDEAAVLFSSLRGIFESGRIRIDGTIVQGLGEGKFYLSLPGYRKQIREKLGFDPFPGTLNVRLDGEQAWKRQLLLDGEPIIISGFRGKDRAYGDLFAYRCRLGRVAAAVIFPLRTTHGTDIIEIIAPQSLRRTMRLGNGSRVTIVF